MSKTFTCREFGGVCEMKFSGNTLMEIIQKGMPHMGSDDAHKQHTKSLEATSGENKEQWMGRMQREFDARPDDN